MMTEFLTQNLGLKMFSLVLAIMLELYFNSPVNSVTADLSARIEVRKVPAGMMVVEPPRGGSDLLVRFRVRGPSPLVDPLRAAVLRFEVTIPDNIDKTFIAKLDSRQLRLPRGVVLYDMEPQTIEFRLERVVRKELSVIVEQQGEVAKGYTVEEVMIAPALVSARGPRGELEGLQTITTETIDIGGLDRTRRFEVGLAGVGHSTSLNVNVVSVTVQVAPLTAQKTVNKVPIKLLSPNGVAASVEPSSVSVVLAGPVNELEKVKASEIELLADVRTLTAGRHELEVAATLPAGLELVKTVPEKVVINIVSAKNE